MSTELISIPKPIPTEFIKGEVATELSKHELITIGQFLHAITPLVRQSNDIGGEVKFMLEMCLAKYETIYDRFTKRGGKVAVNTQWYVLGDNELIGPFKTKREASEMYPDTQVWKVAK